MWVGMISSSQKLPVAKNSGARRIGSISPEINHSLCCIALVTSVLFLGASSTRPPSLPETVTLLNSDHFSHLESMQNGGKELFVERIETRLPKYKGLIRGAAGQSNIDWHLLAAMSYQESFWNPDATSPTGVRGFMMLTQETATELNVDDRLNARQSIQAGATYYSQLHDRLPEHILEPDRTWMALAAYNMGMSHLQDARVLTQYYGKNPNLWADVKSFVPLLERKEYYATLKSGFARGEETIVYVQRIQEYYTVLAWHSQMEERALALSSQGNNAFSPVSNTIPGERSNPFSL